MGRKIFRPYISNSNDFFRIHYVFLYSYRVRIFCSGICVAFLIEGGDAHFIPVFVRKIFRPYITQINGFIHHSIGNTTKISKKKFYLIRLLHNRSECTSPSLISLMLFEITFFTTERYWENTEGLEFLILFQYVRHESLLLSDVYFYFHPRGYEEEWRNTEVIVRNIWGVLINRIHLIGTNTLL